MTSAQEKLPIKMLNDRVLVKIPSADGERRSMGGILIPATAQVSKDRKSTRLNSSHTDISRMPSSA